MSQESKERTARHIRYELEQATHVQRELEREHLPAPSGMAIARMASGETAEECNRWMAERETAEAELHARSDYQAAWARVDALADELVQAEHIERMVKRGLPLRHAKLIGAQTLHHTKALTAAIEWEQSGASLLIMLGNKGTGKTLAAAYLARNGGKFITAPKMARMSAYSDEGVVTLERGNILAIDDIGTEFADQKGMFASNLDAVVNERFSNERRTVITANIDLAEWKARYGARLLDRARESGRVVHLTGPSLRGQG